MRTTLGGALNVKMVMTLVVAGAMTLGGSVAAAPPTPASAVDAPEPSADETLMLELVNRARANPQAEAKRIRATPGARFLKHKDNVDWDRFEAEMATIAAQPPLVMHPLLLLAARRHSDYLITNRKRGHKEDPGLQKFSGIKLSHRCREAGYAWTLTAENIYVAFTPWDVHAGFVVDVSRRAPDGMLKGRGHRKAIFHAETREAGTAQLAREKDFLFTHAYADRKANRLVGGVVFDDADGDGFYDPGEGVAGVTITASDGSTTKTWTHGGYALELASRDAGVTLTATHGERTHTKTFEAGRANIKFDWVRAAR